MGKPNISLIPVEAYAMPSNTYIQGDSHCFVVTTFDPKICWKNYGGGWDDSRPKTKVATNQAYKEWILDFIPKDELTKCGITFGVNGVCHTFANIEMLIGEYDANVHEAAKDYVCVFFYGKYGLGLNRLKVLLRESYNRVLDSYNDPYGALDKVLRRVDNCLDDELRAWRQVSIEYAKIPVDEILAKNPLGGLAAARERLMNLINERENIYEQYLDGKIKKDDVKIKVKELIQNRSDNYLNMLCSIQYITESDRATYSNNIRRFLSGFKYAIDAQINEIHENGILNLNLADADLL